MDTSSNQKASSNNWRDPPAPTPLQGAGSGTSVVLDPREAGGGPEVESRKLPSSQYKGVVPQPNGRWGSQIYEKHQRVWLGTFNEEAEAARAYDVAARRFRGRDAVTNFRPLSESSDSDIVELDFMKSRSKAELVDMLRKHTYTDELEQCRSAYGTHRTATSPQGAVNNLAGAIGSERETLFEKSVTPSDVGKLNRLVIPKHQAEKHFPLAAGGGGAAGKGVLLNLVDGGGKVWRFRYSYWNSSQSYVLTKGWSRFVKEKELKAGEVVSFMRSTGPEKQLYIDRRSPVMISRPAPVVMLFGVNISKLPVTKRSREIEVELVAPSHLFQRRRIGAL